MMKIDSFTMLQAKYPSHSRPVHIAQSRKQAIVSGSHNHQPRSSHGERHLSKSPTGQAHRSQFLHSGTVKIKKVQILLRLSQTKVHRPVDVTVHQHRLTVLSIHLLLPTLWDLWFNVFNGSTVAIIIIIIMTRRQLRSVATTLHDDRDPVPSSTPV